MTAMFFRFKFPQTKTNKKEKEGEKVNITFLSKYHDGEYQGVSTYSLFWTQSSIHLIEFYLLYLP